MRVTRSVAHSGRDRLGVRYQAQGRIYVMPYESNGRLMLSIMVEELVSSVASTGAPQSSSECEAA
jgi:hypothetical protein